MPDPQQQARSENIVRAADTVTDDVQRALDLLNKHGRLAAGVGSATSVIPESPAKQLRLHIDSVRGNIAVDQLLRIKASGSGLGQVPQQQLEMLASLLGNLDPSMRPDDLRYNLERIHRIYSEIIQTEMQSMGM
jgi:hypothetical protein